jgi:membrane protein DedA with SNARE-associated domain/rhodanese-related sulfurtransferase
MNETAEFVIQHGYAVLFFWILAEQGALPIPSAPLLMVCGALVRSGHLSAGPILLFGVLACLIADTAWFQIGRSRGKRILGFLCRMALEPDSCVRQTENGFLRYGVRFLLVSKFIPGMNSLAAPLAGSSRVGWGQFLLYDSLGAAILVSFWGAVGYLFQGQLEAIGNVFGRAGSGFLLSILAITGGWIAWKYFQRRRFFKKLFIARIPVEELRRMLEAGEEVVVIDIRGTLSTEAGSIPGAVRIPLSEFAARHAEIPRDREIILFCTCPNEASSARAALILKKYGITRVRPLQGGADAWLEMLRTTRKEFSGTSPDPYLGTLLEWRKVSVTGV